MGDISKDINSKFPNSKVKATLNILYTANWIKTEQNTFFQPFKVSAQQYNILRILRGAKEPLKAQTIKERMIERAPNATRLMDKLSDKKLIERVRCDHDRRVVYISITKNGLELMTKIDNNFKGDILENLSKEEAVILSDLLDKIR